jgi:tRNA (cytidine/uridine-2'-O-)-methyltransferase
MVNIVLYEPEIPPNTGNIARLCLATNTPLFLVEPLGFSLEDKYLKRAGLDYWQYVSYSLVKSLDSLMLMNPSSTFYFLTTKTTNPYTSAAFRDDDFIVFGPESRGLPEKYVCASDALTIPMMNDKVRSLNLATSVGIVLYEAIRQCNI